MFVVPLYTAMFKEMNNFDRQGGMGGIGMGDGLLNLDGSVTRDMAVSGTGEDYSYGRDGFDDYGSRSSNDFSRGRQRKITRW